MTTNQRYYSSTAGRFLTPDPYTALTTAANNPADSQSWNRYVYVLSDPLNFVDKPGLLAEKADEGTPESPLFDCYINGQPAPAQLCVAPSVKLPKVSIECEIRLLYRDVPASGFLENHAYLWIRDSTGDEYIMEGAPINNPPKVKYATLTLPIEISPGLNLGLVQISIPVGLDFGKLWGLTSPGLAGDRGPTEPGHSGDPSAGAIAGPWVCDKITLLKRAEFSYNQQQVDYNLLGPNSNSYAHYLITSAGLDAYFGEPAHAPGWDTPVH